MEGNINVGGEWGRFQIDFYQKGATELGFVGEGGGGLDEGGGADGEEDVTVSGGDDSLEQGVLGEGFVEPNDIGPEQAATIWTKGGYFGRFRP